MVLTLAFKIDTALYKSYKMRNQACLTCKKQGIQHFINQMQIKNYKNNLFIILIYYYFFFLNSEHERINYFCKL